MFTFHIVKANVIIVISYHFQKEETIEKYIETVKKK